MTAGGIPGLYGGYNYQTPTMRALGAITPESYDYRDEGKFMSKLVNDVSFMGGMMRKMQKGIDDANQNFIQQLQSMISDVLVIFGGGGDTGLDFGDLKYIIQAIGALFGFGDGILPINLFQAAWHFFSTYIIPVDNFQDVINFIIDGAVATILDLFGEVPILGQALQQLAVIISNIRDALLPLANALDVLFAAIGGDWLSGDLGAFGPLWDSLSTLFGSITAPIAEALAPLWPLIAQWTVPFVEALTQIVGIVTNIINVFTGGLNSLDDFVGGAFNPVNILINMITTLISGGLLGAGSPLDALNIFNLGNILGKIGIGSLSDESEELLDNSDFREAISLQGGGVWIYDDTKGKTVLGSARVSANSSLRLLVSNTFAVSQGDKINLGVWAQWAGLTYTGTAPIKLQAVQLLYDPVTRTYATMATTDLATVTSPGATQATWFNLKVDDWEVPASTSHLALQLSVGTNATAGTVWFDDGTAKKTGKIELSWIPEAVTNFLGIFEAFGGVGAGLGELLNFVPNLLSLFNLTDVLDMVTDPGSFDPISAGISIIDQLVPGIGGILDNLFGGINRTATTGHTHVEVLDSVTAQNEAVVGTAASLSQLSAALGGGTPDADDFERTSLGATWRTIFSNGGTVTLNGHDMVMAHTADTDYIVLKTDKLASTDVQTSEITLGSAPGFATVVLASARGHNDLWLRCSNFTTWATRTGVRLRWSANNSNIRLSAWVNGTEVVVLFNGAVSNAVAGSRMAFETGVASNPRRFVIRLNGGIITGGDIVESGTASMVGALYRTRGLGGKTELVGVAPLAATPDPGTVRQWVATG